MRSYFKLILVSLIMVTLCSVGFSSATMPTDNQKFAENGFDYVYKYAGYQIDINVKDGSAEVSYPSFITDKEIATAAYSFAKTHNIKDVYYKKISPGKLAISFTKGYSKADFDYIASVASSELTAYLNSIFAQVKIESGAEVKQEVNLKDSPKTEKKPEETKVKEVKKVDFPKMNEKAMLESSFEINDCNINIAAYKGMAFISYPASVLESAVYRVAATFFNRHKDALSEMSLKVIDSGKAILYYPKDTRSSYIRYVKNILLKDVAIDLNSEFSNKISSEAPFASFSYGNINVFVFYGKAIISYPATIGDSTIQTLAMYFKSKNSNLMDCIIAYSGLAMLTFPVKSTKNVSDYIGTKAANDFNSLLSK